MAPLVPNPAIPQIKGRRGRRKSGQKSPLVSTRPPLDWQLWPGSIVPTLRATVAAPGLAADRELLAFLSFNPTGRASFTLRLDQGGSVAMVTHSAHADGCRDHEVAKAWAGRLLDWIDGGRVGSEPMLKDAQTAVVSHLEEKGRSGVESGEAASTALALYYLKQLRSNVSTLLDCARAWLEKKLTISRPPPFIYTAIIHYIYCMMLLFIVFS